MASSEDIRHSFYLFQTLIGVGSILAVWLVFRSSQPKTRFKVREADRKKPFRFGATIDVTAHAEKPRPALLTGLRIDGAPHEILGVPSDAGEEEIQEAYLALIKRYHPDRVGRPGSREWNDAQKIASALNEARKSLLTRLKKS